MQAGVEPQDMITIFFTANKTFNIIQSLEKVTLKYTLLYSEILLNIK